MNADLPSRRRVLSDALVIGCSLSLPWSLTGCDKSKNAGPSTPAPPAAPAASPATMPPPAAPSAAPANGVPPAAGKLAKTAVQYQEQPHGEQQCSRCLHFIAESNTCKLVDGPINPNGWCILWVKKA